VAKKQEERTQSNKPLGRPKGVSASRSFDSADHVKDKARVHPGPTKKKNKGKYRAWTTSHQVREPTLEEVPHKG